MRLSLALIVSFALPALAWAFETKTETVGQVEVFWETEGPYVTAGDRSYALPSEETALKVVYEDAEKLVEFLREHCEQAPGCELSFEIETKAIFGARAPSGESISIPYSHRIMQKFSGPPFTFRTTLKSWVWDTFALFVSTRDGNYCIPNDYYWKDYHDRVYKALDRLGKQENALDVAVTLTVHPADDPEEDCQGYIADVHPAP